MPAPMTPTLALWAFVLAPSGQTLPADASRDVPCAFAKAEQMAAGKESAETIADQTVTACLPAEARSDPAAESRRMTIRAAALAMVNRRRGTDGQPADAPFRLPTLERSIPLGSLTIPDEIAPAITPYLRCQLLSHGVRMGPPCAQTVPTPEQIGADCSAARREAARLGERMLKQQGRGSASQRRAFVEKVLAKVDAFAGPRRGEDAKVR